MENIMNLYNLNYSTAKIAKELNLPYYQVQKYLRDNNLVSGRSKQNYLIDDKILELANQGFTPNQIVETLRTSRNKVIRLFKLNNFKLEGSGGKNKIVKSNPFLPLTEESYYWLGYLLADGCLANNTIIFSQAGKDTEQVVLYRDFINKNLTIHKRKNVAGSDVFVVRFIHLDTYNFLKELGITEKKSRTIKYNGEINSHLLRGIFDGDGYVRYKEGLQYKITTGSINLVQQLETYLKSNNINIYITTKKSVNICYDVNISAKCAKQFYHLLYDNAKIYLNRKKEIADVALFGNK